MCSVVLELICYRRRWSCTVCLRMMNSSVSSISIRDSMVVSAWLNVVWQEAQTICANALNCSSEIVLKLSSAHKVESSLLVVVVGYSRGVAA